ncbi:MAG TPA: hypothetical protein VEW48_01940 [Thermoanaerobaculia bacterium]|nr:hypothetical protein [Thermoanaerobaculia bacterium]
MKALLIALTTAALAAAPLGAQSLSAGPEIPVQSLPFGDIYDTSIAAAADGSFLEAWLDFGRIYARPFSAADAPLLPGSRQLSLESKDSLSAPHAAALSSGRYVVVWTALGTSGAQLPIRIVARIVDPNGQPAGGEILLSEAVTLRGLPTTTLSVAAEPTGGFVIAWHDQIRHTVLARRFDAGGSPAGPEVTVGEGDLYSPSVAALPGGGFAVAWFELHGEILLRLFHPDGLSATPEILVAERQALFGYDTHVTADAAGRVTVVWSEYEIVSGSVTTARARARRFSPGGQPLSPPFVAAEKNVLDRAFFITDVAARPAGSFLVTWWEYDTIVGGFDDVIRFHGDAYARAFDASGQPLGDALPVHASTPGEEYAGEAEPTPGGWIVSWSRQLEGGGAFARRYTLSCGTGTELCLGHGRFRLSASWLVSPSGVQGEGQPIELTSDTGAFWFFQPSNTELLVKILDGTAINGHFWVFYGSLTNVAFDLTITDTATGQQRTYHNPAGTMASRADTEAF